MARRKITSDQEIIAAASTLFEDRGYANTTIDDIAVSLGVTKPTVYAYVPTKERLLEEIFETVLARLESVQARIADLDAPAAQLSATIRAYVETVEALQAYVLIYYGEEHQLSEQTRQRFRQWGRRVTERVIELLERCATDGVVRRDVDPGTAARLLIGMLTSVARWYSPDGSLTPSEIADAATAMLEGYLPVPLEPRPSAIPNDWVRP